MSTVPDASDLQPPSCLLTTALPDYRGHISVVRTDAAHGGPDVGGGDALQILHGHRLARAFLGDHAGVAEPFDTFDDVAGEPAILPGVDTMFPSGGV